LQADYRLIVGDESEPLNDKLGFGIRIGYTGVCVCSACGMAVNKLYGGPYCYDCFTSLARCDLCVMSPSRCHFAQGTCREPQWGEAFCMQAHYVYLANSSGAKVGITRKGRERSRWLDQGASQAVAIAETPTRQAAGDLELVLSRVLSDRTDWRRLVRGPVPDIDLVGLVPQLRDRVPANVPADWIRTFTPVDIAYPVRDYAPPRRCKLEQAGAEICDNLVGIKGQFLLLSQGAFNVAEHQGREVEVEIGAPYAADRLTESGQLTLF
jgi:hypothetical protein